jgi:hypothetical protein
MRSTSKPSSASPLPASRPETVVAMTPPASMTPAPREDAGVTSSRRRMRFSILLVGLNIVLIALVLFLVLRSDGDETPALGASESPPPTASDTALGVAPADIATTTGEDVAAAATHEESDAALAVAEDVAVAPPLVFGSVMGEALGDLDGIFATDVALTIRCNAPNAIVAISGLGIGHAPRVIQARPGTVVNGRVSAADHEPRMFEALVGRDDSITVTLKEVPRGKVHFRFFPAEGTRVKIDGNKVNAAGNVITLELTVGKHTLVLEGRDGQRLQKPFAIEPNETTSLGTLDVGAN